MWDIVAFVAGLILVAGCGACGPFLSLSGKNGPHVPPTPVPGAELGAGTSFNQNDVMFLQMMVPHLEQGRSIARLAKDRASREDVKVLAAAIESTQTDEMATMAARLRDWRQPPTAQVNSHSEHGGMPAIADKEIAALRKTTGPDFDRRFLNVMIAYQDDAIQLARVETVTGSDPNAKALAGHIDRSRSAEIRQMLGFLGQS